MFSSKLTMLARGKGAMLAAFLPLKPFEPVEKGDFDREEAVAEAYSSRSSLTVEERLDLMWSKDPYGNLSPEIGDCLRATSVSFVCAYGYGFTTRAMAVYRKFISDNKHEMFKSPRAAQDVLRKDMMKHASLSGVGLALKLSSMVLVYSLSTQTCNVMRDDINPLDHAACGAVLGSTFCLMRGPKAMIAGAAVGATVGLVGGGSQKLLAVLSGVSFSERMRGKFEEQRVAKDLLDAQTKTYQRDKWYQEGENNDDSPSSLSRTVTSFIRKTFFSD